MNAALLILAGLALVLTTIAEPSADDSTFAELAAVLRGIRWWQPAWWLACVLLGGPAVAIWYAARYALHVAAYVLARASAGVASAAAMDGRGVRIYRTSAGRALAGRPA